MANILFIIAPKNYRDEELEVPRKMFLEAGHTVVVASKGVAKATGMMGGDFNIELDLEDVDLSKYHAVVFVGGSGAAVYFDDLKVGEIVRDCVASGKIIGAICIAPTILANAGILRGVKATAFSSQKANLISNGAVWSDDPVVTDGKIVTGSGPDVAEEFGRAILALLHE